MKDLYQILLHKSFHSASTTVLPLISKQHSLTSDHSTETQLHSTVPVFFSVEHSDAYEWMEHLTNRFQFLVI